MRRLACLAILVCMPSHAVAGDWPQFQHNAARTGYTTDSVSPPYRARWIWLGENHILRNRDSNEGWPDDLRSRDGHNLPLPKVAQVQFGGSMQPICAGNKVYVADVEGGVYCIALDDGRTLWTAQQPAGSLASGVTDGKAVVFASVLGHITAWDAANGQQRWQVDTDRSITAALALDGGVVLAANHGGSVFALRLADGKQLWRQNEADSPIQGGMCVADGRVYLGTESMNAIALDAGTGEVLARHHLTGQSFRRLWPVAAGRYVIFTTVPVVCVGSEFVNDPVLAGTPGEHIGWKPELRSAYPDALAEQHALRKWLAGDGRLWEAHFALDAKTLEQSYIIPTAVTEGCGTPPNPPAINATGQPLLWWATAHPDFITGNTFGTNFHTDLAPLDLVTGLRIQRTGKRVNHTTETDNLYAMSVGGSWVYLRQNFRGTSAVRFDPPTSKRISAEYRRRDGGGWASPLNYADDYDKGDRVPQPSGGHQFPPAGRAAPVIVNGRLLFCEWYGLTCIETGWED